MKHTKHETKPAEPAAEAEAAPAPEQSKADENWDRYLRAVADLENFKKRAARERAEASSYANQALLQKLLPILDNFEAAQTAAESAQGDSVQSLKAGVAMIQQQLKAALAEAGLEEINAIGQPFNPNFHEAISEVESAEVPDHHVLQQLRKGYKLRDRLLRPSMVIVAKAPTNA